MPWRTRSPAGWINCLKTANKTFIEFALRSKRLRALLRLIRPAVDPAFFNRENRRLRTAAGLLSFARDTAVARGTLTALPGSDQADQDAVQSVLAGLENNVELPNDGDRTMAEVKRRLEQTR